METPHIAQPSAASSKKKLMWIALAGVAVLAITWAVVFWRMQDAEATISEATISIGQEGINPSHITIKNGQAVSITNRDVQPHNLAADAEALPGFTTSEPLSQGDSYTYVFDQKGTYRLYDPANTSNYTATVVVE
jgi:plastocyanin